MENCHCHKSSPTATLSELTDKLRSGDRRITGPRQAILEVMRRHHHPMTNREIHEALAGELNCDLATVYRGMHMLQKMRMVQRFDFGDGVARFELLADGSDGHHHHLVCTECATIIEIEECFPETLEKEIARKHGYQNVTHKLEFFGICPTCRSTETK